MSAVRNRVLVAVVVITILGLLFANSSSSGSKRLGGTEYITESVGAEGTLEFKRFFFHADGTGSRVSPWHHIPLRPPGAPEDVFNFVCEIPKGTRAKMEINKEEEWNPIIQDVKKGKLRFYPSDSLVNYGAFPQTWEDGDKKDGDSGLAGDNDPLDVLDIGAVPCSSGDVYPVKVLGILGMLDGEEMDWKVVAVAVTDPLAAKLNDVGSETTGTPAEVTSFLDLIEVWFRDYKIPDGKPANKFAFDGKFQSKAFALNVVKEQYAAWQALYARDPKAARADGAAYAEFWWAHQPTLRRSVRMA